jgi:hypothetical protein
LKEKHTLIVALLLLGLVVYYSFFEYNASLKEKEIKPGPLVFELSPWEVKKVEIQRLDGGEFIGERTEGRGWILLKGNRIEQWESKVNDFIFNLLMLVEIEKFKVENSQVKNYGMENPAYKIILTDITDKTYQLLIGDSNPVRTSVYVKFVESPNVIITGAILNHHLWKISPLLAPAN